MTADVLFSHICHQQPDRSLAVAGILLPVCARCAGFYLGVAFTTGFYLIPDKKPLFLRWPTRGLAALAALAALPNALNIYFAKATKLFGWDNYGRFFAGAAAGWGLWILLAGAAALLRWGRAPERRLTLDKGVSSLVLLLLPVIALAAASPAVAVLLTTMIIAGALAFYGGLFYLPFALILHKKRSPLWLRAVGTAVCLSAAVAAIRWGHLLAPPTI